MVDEMMDVTDSEDSVLASASGQAASNLLNELTANDRTVHNDFHSDFTIDMFNDNDLV